MADQQASDAGGRATVAMVLRTVDDLRALTDAHFKTVRVQLDALRTIPDEVHAMKERQLLLEARVTVIEQADASRRTYRSGTLPLILIGVAGTVINAALFFASH